MAIHLSIKAVNIDVAGLVSKVNDDTFWLAVAQEYKKQMKPFVPKKNSHLQESARVRPKEVEYWLPYARYIYEGNAMGPTYPIKRGGTVVGFYSPRGVRKHLTGAKLKFNSGSEKWDEKNHSELERRMIAFVQKKVDSMKWG